VMETMYEWQGRSTKGLQELMFLLFGRDVQRFHTVPMLHGENLATHQFGVAWLVYLITEGTVVCTVPLIMSALSHDMAEQLWGDIPAPAKKLLNADQQFSNAEAQTLFENGMFFALTESERAILKIADYMEGMLTCVHERRMGNRYMEIIYQRRFRQYVLDYRRSYEQHLTERIIQRVATLFRALDELWKETLAPYSPVEPVDEELALPNKPLYPMKTDAP